MVGDRLFTTADLDLIRWTTDRFGNLSRWELALTICENLEWKAPNGELRVHSCVPLLEQLAAADVLRLPAKRQRPVRGPARLPGSSLGPMEIAVPLAEVRPITVEPVPAGEQAVWDATVAAQHALGFQRAFGEHQRYWIYGEVDGSREVLGALLYICGVGAQRGRARRMVGLEHTGATTVSVSGRRQQSVPDPQGCACAAPGQPCPGTGPATAAGLAGAVQPPAGGPRTPSTTSRSTT